MKKFYFQETILLFEILKINRNNISFTNGFYINVFLTKSLSW